MRNDNNNLWGALFLLGIVVFVAILMGLKTWLGLSSVDTSARIFLNLFLFVALTVVSRMYGGDMLGPGQTWPILLAIFSMCGWPVLDDWAGQSVPAFLGEAYAPWWDAWYTKWGVAVGFITIGYGIKKWRSDD
ncbi:MAG: hypothetical protein PHR30_14950 [Gallionellaceae bacterium]|nr:hypothetical protein [Gallionellaceae bacterium]